MLVGQAAGQVGIGKEDGTTGKARTLHRIFLVEHFMLMEWNLKNPLQWDWETLALLSAKESEISKSDEQLEWRVEGGLISNGSLYSSGSGTCTGSELCIVSSKNSISASVGSSSKVRNKISEVNFEAVEDFSENQNKNNGMAWEKDPKTSPLTVGFIGAGEPPIGLKLGKRTYFENLISTNIKTSTSSVSMMPPTASVKRPKACHQGNQHSCCQVEGCNIDLTASKDYHRKHRVCERHSKSPRVLVSGFERRFCQQCSRFHDLSEFDQKKRSCRRRLSDHNARRRKPQPKALSFNHSRLSSLFYDERQQMNIFLNLAPFNHVRPSTSSLWDDPHVFRLSMTKGSWNKPTKAGIDGQLCVPMMDFSTTADGTHDDFGRLVPFKCTTTEVLSQGLEASSSGSNLNGAPDLQCALSLLSSDAWIPSSTAQSNMIQLPSTYPTASHPSVQVNSATECWQDEEHSLTEQVLKFNLYGNGSHLQEFHLNKAPYGSPLFEANQIFPKSDGHFLESKT